MKKITRIIFIIIIILSSLTYLAYTNISKDFDLDLLNTCFVTKMNKVYLCSTSPRYVSIKKIPSHFIQALIVSEDIQFLNHSGFEWDEIKNSIKKNIASLKFKRGGSTITQQLVKNIYFSGEKSIARKVKEAFITYKIEKQYSKNFILEKYINVVEFGHQIYGIEQASKRYFNTSAENLSLWQSVFLVYLLPNPKVYSKVYQKGHLTEFATLRMLDISNKLFLFKKISKEEHDLFEQRIKSNNLFDLAF